jgi:hypothetical protein
VSRWASEYDASKVDVMDTKKFLEELFGEKLTLHFTSCRKFDNTFFKKVSELLEMIQNPHFPSDPVTNRALNLIKKAIEDHQEWERNGCHGCGKYGTHDHGPCWL